MKIDAKEKLKTNRLCLRKKNTQKSFTFVLILNYRHVYVCLRAGKPSTVAVRRL